MTNPQDTTPANPTPPGWPDPLESPQAEAIRNGKLDDTEIRNLFDCMERELRLHRERAANPAQPEKLGRFGHHPDPATDFETEVHDLECEVYHHRVAFLNGTPPLADLIARIERAMEFQVGGVETAVAAKQRLRELEKEAAALLPANPAQRVSGLLLKAAEMAERSVALNEVYQPREEYLRFAQDCRAAIGAGTPSSEAQFEHMVQRFLQWKLPDDFNPDGGIQFVKKTDYGHTFEPVGTNLLDYRQAKAMVQHILEGLPAIGAGGQAVAAEIGDAVLAWMVKYDLLDGDNEYQVADVMAVMDDLVPSSAIANPVQPGWRDMESAPKDGTEILYRNRFGGIGYCHWDEGYNENEIACWWDNEVDDEVCPVAWLPADTLPAAPQPKGE